MVPYTRQQRYRAIKHNIRGASAWLAPRGPSLCYWLEAQVRRRERVGLLSILRRGATGRVAASEGHTEQSDSVQEAKSSPSLVALNLKEPHVIYVEVMGELREGAGRSECWVTGCSMKLGLDPTNEATCLRVYM